MNTCLICPIPDLEKYVDDKFSYHLTLAQLMNSPGYQEFYAGRSALGDYIILDNGAKERGAGLGMEDILNAAMKVIADEIVLTDVRYKCIDTIDSSIDGLKWIREEGRDLYNGAGNPKLMVVPQGQSIQEWKVCLSSLLTLVGHTRERMAEMPEPSVGFAYHYDHMFDGGLLKLLDAAKVETLDIHLLGWPRELGTLRRVSREFPFLRSVDSGRPISYARAELPIDDEIKHHPRSEDFFIKPTAGRLDWLVKRNIETFRKWAGDES